MNHPRIKSSDEQADHVPNLLYFVDSWLLKKIASEHSVGMRREVVAWVGGCAYQFSQLVEIVLHGSCRMAQRASYPMSFAVEAWPKLGSRHVLKLLENLGRSDIHGGVVRNTIRMLRFVPLNPRYDGQLFSVAMAALSGSAEIAVKADAISILARLVSRFPEMRTEVESLIYEGLAAASPAYHARVRQSFPHLKRDEIKMILE